jgi:hypothetical protein
VLILRASGFRFDSGVPTPRGALSRSAACPCCPPTRALASAALPPAGGAIWPIAAVRHACARAPALTCSWSELTLSGAGARVEGCTSIPEPRSANSNSCLRTAGSEAVAVRVGEAASPGCAAPAPVRGWVRCNVPMLRRHSRTRRFAAATAEAALLAWSPTRSGSRAPACAWKCEGPVRGHDGHTPV